MSSIPSLEKIKHLYPFESNFFDIEGKKYHYVDEGEGRPLIMVHGNPTWSFFYRDVIKAFSSTRRCIAVDHIGCGLSDKPQDYPYLLENHISNLEKLIEHLGIKEFDLAVHDWGGAIGFGLATRHPEKVGKITVFNTAAFLIDFIPFRINLCRMPIFGKMAVQGFNAFAGAATVMTTVKPLAKDIKEGFVLPYNNFKNRIATHRFVLDIPMKPSHPSWKTVEEIESKLSLFKDDQIMICWGKHDWCFNDRFLTVWKQKYPNAKVNEYEAGHYLLEDKGEEIIAEMKSFLG